MVVKVPLNRGLVGQVPLTPRPFSAFYEFPSPNTLSYATLPTNLLLATNYLVFTEQKPRYRPLAHVKVEELLWWNELPNRHPFPQPQTTCVSTDMAACLYRASLPAVAVRLLTSMNYPLGPPGTISLTFRLWEVLSLSSEPQQAAKLVAVARPRALLVKSPRQANRQLSRIPALPRPPRSILAPLPLSAVMPLVMAVLHIPTTGPQAWSLPAVQLTENTVPKAKRPRKLILLQTSLDVWQPIVWAAPVCRPMLITGPPTRVPRNLGNEAHSLHLLPHIGVIGAAWTVPRIAPSLVGSTCVLPNRKFIPTLPATPQLPSVPTAIPSHPLRPTPFRLREQFMLRQKSRPLEVFATSIPPPATNFARKTLLR